MIECLTFLEQNPTSGYWLAKGIPEAEIAALETKIGRRFPKAYREFLLLAGDVYPFSGGTETDFESLPERQQALLRELSEHSMTSERLCWAFGDYGLDQFFIFYWDEGENPPVYYTSPAYAKSDSNFLIEKKTATFSEFIERDIITHIHSVFLLAHSFIGAEQLNKSLKTVAEKLGLLYKQQLKPSPVYTETTITSPVNGSYLYFGFRNAEKFNETAKDDSPYKGQGIVLHIIFHGNDVVLIPFLKEFLTLYPLLSVFNDTSPPFILRADDVLALKSNKAFVELFPKTRFNQ